MKVTKFKDFLKLNESQSHGIVELERGQLKTDSDIFSVLNILQEKGISASSGGRNPLTDIIVDARNVDTAAEILYKQGYKVKQIIG
jgi:hypothetical protein